MFGSLTTYLVVLIQFKQGEMGDQQQPGGEGCSNETDGVNP
jgi:hypothetical protein